MAIDVVMISGWAHCGLGLQRLANLIEERFSQLKVHLLSPAELFYLSPRGDLDEGLESWLALQPEPVVLIGWSLGGVLSLKFALEYQSKVLGLILLGASAGFCHQPGGVPKLVVENIETAVMSSRSGLLDALSSFYRACGEPERLSEAELELLLNEQNWDSAESLAVGLKYLREVDLFPRLSELVVPALFVSFDSDLIVPQELSGQMRQMLSEHRIAGYPDVESIELNGLGHSAPITRPVEVFAALKKFLGELSDR